MKITIKENSSEKAVVLFSGELDTTAAQKLADDLEPVMQDAGKKIVLDMTELKYISSAGLRVLLLLNKRSEEKGGKVVIKGISENIKQIFQLVGFEGIFDFE